MEMTGKGRSGRSWDRARILAALPVLCLVAVAAQALDCEQRERLGRLQVPFVVNEGQLSDGVAYSASTSFGSVLVGRDGGVVYLLPLARAGGAGASLTETFVGASPVPTAGALAQGSVSYFLGADRDRWRSELATYDEVNLGQPWPGVLVRLRAHARNVEKIFTVLPGASAPYPAARRGGRTPFDRSRWSDRCLLVRWPDPIHGAGGIPGSRGSTQARRRGLCAAWVHVRLPRGLLRSAAPLVIDPVLQSTYVGGADPDSVEAIAVDPGSGDVIVAGYTYSTNGHGVDGFVARFDPTLTTLRHSTYFGGSLGEEILGVAVHPATGDVYVAGYTASSDLPGTLTGAQRAYAGGDDGFVARFDSTLGQLLGSTYLGGSQPDRVVAIAIPPRTARSSSRPDRLERLSGHERRGPARARPRRGLHPARGLRGPPRSNAPHAAPGHVPGRRRAGLPSRDGDSSFDRRGLRRRTDAGARLSGSGRRRERRGIARHRKHRRIRLPFRSVVDAPAAERVRRRERIGRHFGIAIHPGSGDVYVVGGAIGLIFPEPKVERSRSWAGKRTPS